MSRIYNLRSRTTKQTSFTLKKTTPMLADPITGLDMSIVWTEDVVRTKAQDILDIFAARGVVPEVDSEVHFTKRDAQNCFLILLNEEKGHHLSVDFYCRPYWKVLQEIFPYGVILPEENRAQDRQHIYSLHGIRRTYIVLDLDFMPGVTEVKILQSMVLHFDPVNMPLMFDTSKLPAHFECTTLPVIVQKHRFLNFEEIHQAFKSFYASKSTVIKLSKAEAILTKQFFVQLNYHGRKMGLDFTSRWEKLTTSRFLKLHESTSLDKPNEQLVFQAIDWSPKATVGGDTLEDVGPLDGPGCMGDGEFAGENRYTMDIQDPQKHAKMEVDVGPKEPEPPADPPFDDNMRTFICQKWESNLIQKNVLRAFEDLKKGLNGLAMNAPEWMAENYPEWMEYNHPDWRRGRFKRN